MTLDLTNFSTVTVTFNVQSTKIHCEMIARSHTNISYKRLREHYIKTISDIKDDYQWELYEESILKVKYYVWAPTWYYIDQCVTIDDYFTDHTELRLRRCGIQDYLNLNNLINTNPEYFKYVYFNQTKKSKREIIDFLALEFSENLRFQLRIHDVLEDNEHKLHANANEREIEYIKKMLDKLIKRSMTV